MVYSIREGQTYLLQDQQIAEYGGRRMVLRFAEMITYIGQRADGYYIFLKRDKHSIALPSLFNVFNYSVGPDIYVPYKNKNPNLF